MKSCDYLRRNARAKGEKLYLQADGRSSLLGGCSEEEECSEMDAHEESAARKLDPWDTLLMVLHRE